MLLEDKTAVIYGGAGPVGSAVARAFAAEGARVVLAGRTPDPLKDVADGISAAGGVAEAVRVDALDEEAVDRFVQTVVERAGRIDVSFTAIGHGDVHGPPLVEMSFEDFSRPIVTAMRAHFLTGRAAARQMIRQGSGVLMAITATTARLAVPNVGGTAVTFDAIESLCRQWASELGRHGVRAVWLRTTGLPEDLHGDTFPDYGTGGGTMSREELVGWLRGTTMLDRLTTLADLGNAAAFLASDRASAMTATSANLSCGAVPD